MNYEFTQEQNERLEGLVSGLRMFSYGLILGGSLQAMAMCVTLVNLLSDPQFGNLRFVLGLLLIIGMLGAFLGFFLQKAAHFFLQMVQTEGHDIELLMSALARLEGFFRWSGGAIWVVVLILLGATIQGFLQNVLDFNVLR